KLTDKKDVYKSFYNALEDVIENSEEEKASSKASSLLNHERLTDVRKVTKICGDFLDRSNVLDEVTNTINNGKGKEVVTSPKNKENKKGNTVPDSLTMQKGGSSITRSEAYKSVDISQVTADDLIHPNKPSPKL
ncbi:26420_t:CDS:2, partial [Dentiscutata erythropus]